MELPRLSDFGFTLSPRAKASEKLRRSLLEKKYGITYEQATQMLKDQNYTCPICLNPLGDQIGRDAQVEHDHKTMRVRGIVCLRCNLALGWIQDDISRLERIALYLRKP